MSFQELLKQPSPLFFNTLFDLIPTASSIKCPLGLKLSIIVNNMDIALQSTKKL